MSRYARLGRLNGQVWSSGNLGPLSLGGKKTKVPPPDFASSGTMADDGGVVAWLTSETMADDGGVVV